MLYFIIDALCIVVPSGAFLVLGDTLPGQNQTKTIELKVDLLKVGK